MKKLLGLLLNCTALCLCSAIGIGAGMYWIQTTQGTNSSPAPIIQQVEGTGTQSVQQTPDLINPPVNHLTPTTPKVALPVTEIAAEIKQVSLLQSTNEPSIKKVEISKDDLPNDYDTITSDATIERKGPRVKLKVTINEDVPNGYSLKFGSGSEKLDLIQSGSNSNVYQSVIKKTGDYKIVLSKDENSQELQRFNFKINKLTQGQPEYPVITSLTDTASPNILYSPLSSISSNTTVNGISSFLLRSSSLKFTISKSKDRTTLLQFQKIGTIPSTSNNFKDLSNITPVNLSDTSESFSLTGLADGIYQFRFKDSWLSEQGEGLSKTVTIIIPKPESSNPLKPSILSYQNHKYAKPNTNVKSTIAIFGGNLKLSGTNANPKQSLKFMLFNNVNGHLTLAPSDQLEVTSYQADQNGEWNATLKISSQDLNSTIYALRIDDETQFAFSAPINIQKATSTLANNSNNIPLNQFKIGSTIKTPTPIDKDTPVFLNTNTPIFETIKGNLDNIQYVIFTHTSNTPLGYGDFTNNKRAKLLAPIPNGQHKLYIKYAQGNQLSEKQSDTFNLNIQKNGLEVIDIQPPNFGTAPGVVKLKIKFSVKNQLKTANTLSPTLYNAFQLIPSKGTGIFLSSTAIPATGGVYLEHDNSVVLTFPTLPADIYQLIITGNKVSDIFGNFLEGTKGEPGTNYVRVLNKPDAGSSGSIPPEVGVSDFVEYRDYEKREPTPPGFNPSDRVVTRVARLYYYRDAHRVAQILNSEVQSLNHKGYHQAQILADKARNTYETTVKQRRIQEEKSIRAAKDLREKENDYRNQQQILGGLVRERAILKEDDSTGKKDQLDNAITAAQGQLTSLRTDISRLSGIMNTEDDKLKSLKLEEDQLSATLFQREVQAEKTDLYTIANGHPDSYDAVRQVTIKVIGEGLIHLRGPIKGVNIIRTMINQIDSPVGQVRIAMHTIQINGEDGKRMENVADRIQKSIDQSRFLTVQSAQMLRKAVISVASEVAISTCQDEGIGFTQEQRDQKYLYAFFGRDFIQALEDMDSEFLQSGNKMLSIHSMDTTSLSSALFVLALAKNEIRQQILAQFYASIETELPNAEYQFLYQGGPTKATKHKVKLLSQFAHFQSFKGFFDHNVIGTDTMTPIQREFVRLAQIFKAKLTTERELRLHVMERAVIEQTMDDNQQELLDAKAKEKAAEEKLKNVQESIQKSQLDVIKASTGLQASVSQIINEYQKISTEFDSFQKAFDEIITAVLNAAYPEINIDLSKLTSKERRSLLNKFFPPGNDDTIFDVQLLNLLKKLFESEINDHRMRSGMSGQRNNDELFDALKKANGSFVYGGQTFKFKIEGNKFVLADQSEYALFDQITNQYINQANEAIKKLELFNLTPNMKSNLNNSTKYQKYINPDQPTPLRDIHRVAYSFFSIQEVSQNIAEEFQKIAWNVQEVIEVLSKVGIDSKEIQAAIIKWREVSNKLFSLLKSANPIYKKTKEHFQSVDSSFNTLAGSALQLRFAKQNALDSRQDLDHKKFLDMQIDQTEDRYIELVEGTRSHTANIDNYLQRIATALEDDFNTQFYTPAFRAARDASRYWNVSFGSIETSSILTNNRSLGKVAPKATMEFDLPKRQLAIIEGMNIAQAAVKEYGALVNDPTFLAITSMNGGENVQGGFTIPPDSLEKQVLGQPGSQGQTFGSAFENLIPDPAVFKFETGTGFTVRPVIQPDGQSVIFDLNYLYRTNVREPVRADEKHLGRIKEHFIDTDVQLGNYELREISRFVISLKATRTGNGVPLLSDVPGVGVLFRPTPSAESSLQQSQIMSQAVIFPTLFDLMGLRWAPAVADVGPLQLMNREFISKGRDRYLKNRVYDYAGSKVDEFLRIQETERRSDLYRTQQTIPDVHPNGYMGPGLNLKRSRIQENYDAEWQNPPEKYAPESIRNGVTDPNHAVPVIPSSPRFKPLPEIPPTVPPSSALPMKDLNLKPASWSPTEPKSLPATKGRSSQYLKTNGISSPRRIPSKANEVKAIINTKNRQQPPAPKRSSFYKRSASRIKSYFKKK
ncbi:hypothetical protein [Gimesia aquarii]|uniref:Uncharacterized protein n=1 Tax=Gimesia aquarii TaxID=2527964 RepID=A0A517WTT8_9PLAN|nr:hypothetical protein [Gimesia aquarii]QDU08675.1 hypothetical protein V202x_20450 [Gimesia aquarii]